MKKIYFLASLLLVSGAASAQYMQATKTHVNYDDVRIFPSHSEIDRAAGDVIGSIMNFDTPSDWANDGGNAQDWLIGTTTPNGPFTSGADAIASTSGGNFALCQGDGFTGTSILTLAAPVNCGAFANVGIQFESYYRQFTGSAFVEISNNGTAWTTYPVHDLIPVNEGTDNPELVSLNISTVAGNQATVWVRFRYESTDDYYWMVDDVAFVEGYDDQLTLTQAYMFGGTEGLDYYQIPVSQAMPTTFAAWTNNGGLNDQTNTTLTVEVNGGTDYSESSSASTVSAFTIDSLAVDATAWTPAAGTHTVDYYVESADYTDQLLADNEIILEDIFVGGGTYARDNDIATSSIGYLGSTAVPTLCGNYFEFADAWSFGKIQVGISSTSVEGTPIYVEVRKWNGSDFVFEEGSNDYNITASDIGGMAEITMNGTVTAAAGDVFMIGAGHYGTDDVRFLAAQIAEGVVIFNDGQGSAQNSAFMLRAVEVFAGVEEETTTTGMSVYPNPTNNMANLVYNLTNEADVKLTVTDLTGKVVMTENYGSQVKGSYKVDLNTSEFANGVYFYTVNVNGVNSTKKFTVSH
jgi:Secretion system C-terminal sorting domain